MTFYSLSIVIIFQMILLMRANEVIDNRYNSTHRNLQQARSEFLIYSPQFGLYNQQRALYHALAVARVLNRVLVVPDIVSNNGAGPIVPRNLLFDNVLLLEEAKSFVISTADYQKLLQSGMAESPTKIISLPVPIKQLVPSMYYYNYLNMKNLPHEFLSDSPKFHFSENDWFKFANSDPLKVMHDSTIAFYSMYMCWMDNKFSKLQWLENLEAPIYKEAPWISKFVKQVIDTRMDLSEGYICGHIRRGDFKASCSAYGK